jgi:hypothetical protein
MVERSTPYSTAQGLVRELEAQHHKGHQHPLAEDQPVAGSASFGTPPQVTSALPQRAFVGGSPWAGEFGDQLAKVVPGEPSEARTGQGRTDPC